MKSTPNPANRYLWFRPDSSVIWFRMAVPKKFRDAVGKAMIAEPLDTNDKRIARIKAHTRRAELLQEWGAIPAMHTPTPEELESIAVSVGFDTLTEFEDSRRRGLAGASKEEWQRFARRAEINQETARHLAATGDASLVSDLADIAIAELRLDLPAESEGYRKLCELLNAARLAAVETSALRTAGDIEAEHASKLVGRVRDRAAAKAKPGETIMELFERMAEEQLAKDELRPDTANQNRKVLQLFAEFVGQDRAIESITPQEVGDFRDARRDVPPKWGMKREFRGLSLREAADKARGLELPKTSFVTVNRELSTISPLFKWLRGQPRWRGVLGNPCDGLFYQKVKGKNPRPPYGTEALNKILGSPLFTGFLADDKEHLPGNLHADDWRNWIPLVAMFTGARAGEIAQLRVCDVREEHGTWFVHMIEDSKAGLTVKNRKRRVAAVHTRLVALGFVAFVERRREIAGDEAPLFPELIENDRKQIGAEPSAWWRDYLARIGVKDTSAEGGDGFGLHSFRHELADRLRSEAELLDNEVAVCLGHSIKSTTGGYGRVPQGTVKMMRNWIEAVRWEGVKFEPIASQSS